MFVLAIIVNVCMYVSVCSINVISAACCSTF